MISIGLALVASLHSDKKLMEMTLKPTMKDVKELAEGLDWEEIGNKLLVVGLVYDKTLVRDVVLGCEEVC